MTWTATGAPIDLTDAATASEALARAGADTPFNVLADHLPIGVFLVDTRLRVVWTNRALAELTGRPVEPGHRAPRLDSFLVDDTARLSTAASRVFERAGSRVLDCRLVAADGAIRAVRCRLAAVPAPRGEVLGLIGTVADHSEAERQLQHRATHDDLTDLPNRALLAAQLEAVLGRVGAHGGSVAVLFVGLQRIGVVVDVLGHAAGDRLVRQASRRIIDAVGPEALVSRFAEDRFVVVVEDVAGARAAAQLAGAVVTAMEDAFVVVDDDEAFVSAAVGVAVVDGTIAAGVGVDQLVSDAGVAMARAAEAGVAVEVFDAEMRAEVEERRTLELRLRRGVERGEFELAYQPIVELATDRVAGFEALARWTDPPSTGMGPAQFIPVAEDSGLIGALGAELLAQACEQLARWQRTHPEVVVSVNLSARQLADPELPERVQRALALAGADAAGLHLEITETVLLDDVDRAVASLQQLKSTGVHLSLDDFGTGYSSLSYLCRLPVDVVKIDRSFVSGLGVSERDTSVVAAIVGMASTLGHDLVAEGVETADQAAHLLSLGCRLAQGYLWSRPVSAEVAGTLLDD